MLRLQISKMIQSDKKGGAQRSVGLLAIFTPLAFSLYQNCTLRMSYEGGMPVLQAGFITHGTCVWLAKRYTYSTRVYKMPLKISYNRPFIN